jgi:hypothetical protein
MFAVGDTVVMNNPCSCACKDCIVQSWIGEVTAVTNVFVQVYWTLTNPEARFGKRLNKLPTERTTLEFNRVHLLRRGTQAI